MNIVIIISTLICHHSLELVTKRDPKSLPWQEIFLYRKVTNIDHHACSKRDDDFRRSFPFTKTVKLFIIVTILSSNFVYFT